LFEEFLATAEARNLMVRLIAELSFEQRSIRLFGKKVLQPRLIAWAGKHPYSYSGDTLEPREFPRAALSLLSLINASLKETSPAAPPFNHMLANLYRNGSDSMGMHSDNERELGATPFIASVSLGATRTFSIAPKKIFRKNQPKAPVLRIPLTHGSLLLMVPPTQENYLHGISKTKKPVAERLNLTFRCVQI